MFCRECGAAVPDGAAFCQKCGTRQDDSAQVRRGSFGGPKLEQEELFSQRGLLSLKGRRSRKNFNLLFFSLIFVNLILTAVIKSNSSLILGLLLWVVALLLSWVSITNIVKRLHDVDLCGWWIFLPFIQFYLMVKQGTQGPNRFGENPLG